MHCQAGNKNSADGEGVEVGGGVHDLSTTSCNNYTQICITRQEIKTAVWGEGVRGGGGGGGG